jgi:hypothetical protein
VSPFGERVSEDPAEPGQIITMGGRGRGLKTVSPFGERVSEDPAEVS